MNRKLKRIGPLKFGVVVGAIYGLFSLVFIPFFALGILISIFAPHPDAQPGLAQFSTAIGIGFSIFFCVAAPILYGLMGFLLGALMAWLYNVVAKWTGGIEFEVE